MTNIDLDSGREGSGSGRTVGKKGGKEVADEERVAIERSLLISERQSEIERVLNKHDDYVREAFHLENFLTLVYFDPKVAKDDDSAVFREYKAKYDLVEKASTTTSSRKTRSAHTERLQALKGSSSVSAGLSKVAISHHVQPRSDVIAATARGKGKEKVSHAGLTDASKDKSQGARVVPIHPLSYHIDGTSLFDDSMTPTQNGTERRHKRSSMEMGSISTNGYAPPRKRRKTESILFSMSDDPPTSASAAIHAGRSTRRLPLGPSSTVSEQSRRVKKRLTPQAHSDIAPAPTITALAEPKKLTIKRVKLVVRRPPLPLSNPKQRPLPAKHASSLPAFLSSYTTVNDRDMSAEALGRMAATEASLLSRIASFRQQGRLLPGADIFLGATDRNMSFTDPKRGPDTWDHILAAVATRSRIGRRSHGQQIASQIASKIQSYWDGHAARKDKARLQEERQLRALARATIKMVTREWKKAVFHIREQERLKVEAEEMRRGHEHLDAILDQSGQLLETQHVDLNKRDLSRSRSSSVSATFHNWGDDEEEDADADEEEEVEEDVEEEGDEEGREGEDREKEEEEDENVEEEDENEEGDEDEDEELNVGEEFSSDGEDEDTGAILLLGNDSTRRVEEDGGTESLDGEGATSMVFDDESPDKADRGSMTPTRVEDEDNTKSSSGDYDQDSVLAVDEIMAELTAPGSSPVVLKVRPSGSAASSSSSSPLPFRAPGPDESFDAQLLLVHSPRSCSGNSDGLSPSVDLRDDVRHEATKHRGKARLLVHTVVEDEDQNDSSRLVSGAPSTPDTGDTLGADPRDSEDENAASIVQETDLVRATASPGLEHDLSIQEPGFEEKNTATEAVGGVDEPALEEEQEEEEAAEDDALIPDYLKPFAVAPVAWYSDSKIKPPLLLRGVLRPYQQSGLEWLASLHTNNLNGILADEMGLGKTIQTIALLAHLACDRGIWGPHLIVVPTSVLLNWEMEFKKFLPGFKILSYHGSTKRRKELRQGWNDRHRFNVCITSYTLASRDAHIFKRKAWYYLILDEAHMIKNFKSQRWNILLMFRSFRRLLLTGTPLQNNLTELWALLQFLMSGSNFANLKEFGEWFSNPLEKAIEMGTVLDDENLQRVSKLHTVLRPYLLRRLKRDVEKELPSKYEHLVLCPLSKRQRFLYDEFMARAQTRDALQSGVYQKVANILMQLRKVCNHPDLFEVRPIVTSFAMERSAVADFEIQELLIRRRMLEHQEESLNLEVLGLRFIEQQQTPMSLLTALESRRLDATSHLPFISELPGEPPPKDSRTIAGFREWTAYQRRASTIARWAHIGYLNRFRCNSLPIYGQETISVARRFYKNLLPLSAHDQRTQYLEAVSLVHASIKSYATRAAEMASLVDKFAFVTPAAVALDIPRIALAGRESPVVDTLEDMSFDAVLHRASVKLQIAFPDPSLLQYDCGKLQELTRLLREKKAGGHRVLIFTQMTKILDILEVFLNFHGYLYLRLDGATKIEDRQYITERFNADSRVFCFIASSRSGGVGINLTGADTVVFYDSDFNPQMDRQCEDRAHRIGQIRDVHIYRFISQHTVEEAMLRKANQKRSLDDLVIQKGEFDWRSLFGDEAALAGALGEFEDTEDAHAAAVAAREEVVMEGADEADFGGEGEVEGDSQSVGGDGGVRASVGASGGVDEAEVEGEVDGGEGQEEDEGGSTGDYMVAFVARDYEYFRDWRL